MSNILVVTGSPRKDSNSTRLAQAFIEGAQSAGHTAEVFSSVATAVLPCRACDCCWSKDTPCVFNDGMKTAAPLLEKADVLVLATPLYWFTFSAQMKAFIDKLYAYHSANCKRPLNIKKAYLIATGESENDPEEFNGLVETFKMICDYEQWENGGVLIADGLGPQGAVEEKPFLINQAKALGQEV